MRLSPQYKEAWAYIGGLSEPSKMPWYGYNLPATRCKMGSILANIPGTTCYTCYAFRGHYTLPKVQLCLARRYDALMQDMPRWTASMIVVLAHKAGGKEQWFRWHDSGDLQSTEHLNAIAIIARALPHIHFWLPTREYVIVSKWYGQCPENLTLRLSAHKNNVNWQTDGQALTSTVFKNQHAGKGRKCPAMSQGHKCLDCRACWNKKISNIVYKQH